MTMTTRVQSVSIPVADQDRALKFYTEVLGCELRFDAEVFPGARLIEVVPPGSSVSIVLLSPDSEIPIAVAPRYDRRGHRRTHVCERRERSCTTTRSCVWTGCHRCFISLTPTATDLVYLEEESSPAH